MWSTIRLDSDPAHRRNWDAKPCGDRNGNCWYLQDMWIDPGPLHKALMLSAFPAFVLGGLVVGLFGRFGISQVSTFMVFMPVLIFAWYYFIGSLLDRWIRRRPKTTLQVPD